MAALLVCQRPRPLIRPHGRGCAECDAGTFAAHSGVAACAVCAACNEAEQTEASACTLTADAACECRAPPRDWDPQELFLGPKTYSLL